MREFEKDQELYHVATASFDLTAEDKLLKMEVLVEQVLFIAWKNQNKEVAVIKQHHYNDNGTYHSTLGYEKNYKELFKTENASQQYGRAQLYKKLAESKDNKIDVNYFKESMDMFPEMFI